LERFHSPEFIGKQGAGCAPVRTGSRVGGDAPPSNLSRQLVCEERERSQVNAPTNVQSVTEGNKTAWRAGRDRETIVATC